MTIWECEWFFCMLHLIRTSKCWPQITSSSQPNTCHWKAIVHSNLTGTTADTNSSTNYDSCLSNCPTTLHTNYDSCLSNCLNSQHYITSRANWYHGSTSDVTKVHTPEHEKQLMAYLVPKVQVCLLDATLLHETGISVLKAHYHMVFPCAESVSNNFE